MLEDGSGLQFNPFLHSFVSSFRDFLEVVSFGFVPWGFFVLGTRTLCKGGVMIRWLGPWDAVWEPANIPLLFVCNGRVLGTIEHLIWLHSYDYNAVVTSL